MLYLSTLATAALAVLTAGLINLYANIDIQSYLWTIIPIGGFLVAMVGTYGMRFYIKRMKTAIAWHHYVFGGVTGLVIFFSVYFFAYQTTFVDSEGMTTRLLVNQGLNPISAYMSFFEYLQFINRSSSIGTRYMSAVGSGLEIGSIFTNILFWLQALGAIIGGLGSVLIADDAKQAS